MKAVAVLVLAMTACGAPESSPVRPETAPQPEPVVVAGDAKPQPRDAAPEAEPDPPPPEVDENLPELAVVRLMPKDGALGELLASETAKARGAGRQAFVELSAGWCPRCKKLNKSLKDGGGKTAAAGVHLIVLDTDAWGRRLDRQGFTAPTIPTLYELDRVGKPTGRSLNGHGWKKHTDAQISHLLAGFFHPD